MDKVGHSNNTGLPPHLLAALEVIMPAPNKLDIEESIAVCCLCLPFSRARLSAEIQQAVKTEQEQFDKVVAIIKQALLENSSRGQVGVASNLLTMMLRKYEGLDARACELILARQQEDRAARCLGSLFCSSNDVKSAEERRALIRSRLKALQDINLGAVKATFLGLKERLGELELTLPSMIDTRLAHLTLSQLRASINTLIVATVKVEEEPVVDEEHQEADFFHLLERMNALLFQHKEERSTLVQIANAFSGVTGSTTTIISKESMTLFHPFKYCLREAYTTVVRILNDHIVKKGYAGDVISELDPAGQFTDISFNRLSDDDNTIRVTSLTTLKLNSTRDSRVVGEVDATLKAEFGLRGGSNSATLTCTFDAIKVTGASRIDDMECLRVIFTP